MFLLLLERMDPFLLPMLSSLENLLASEFCKLAKTFFYCNRVVLKDKFLPEDVRARWRERLIISRCSLLAGKQKLCFR